ncbi:unnamed protein product [Amoebophrya sp. A120]|nr:unnamed protein product [Amoebophrya sp. A120]|eukprot:GSA120T00009767001.1
MRADWDCDFLFGLARFFHLREFLSNGAFAHALLSEMSCF